MVITGVLAAFAVAAVIFAAALLLEEAERADEDQVLDSGARRRENAATPSEDTNGHRSSGDVPTLRPTEPGDAADAYLSGIAAGQRDETIGRDQYAAERRARLQRTNGHTLRQREALDRMKGR